MNGYGRGVGLGSALTDGVKYLLIWNAIFFLLQFILSSGIGFLSGVVVLKVRLHGQLQMVSYAINSIERLLGMVPALIWQKGFIWQTFTYMFLHGSFFHILFNMFALWMFGSDLERIWGTRRFLTYYFFTGIGAGLLTMILTPHGAIPTIGASGAVYGLLLAFAIYFPHRRIFLYFLFPIPARIFVLIFGAIELMSSISQPGDSVAHLAHLGGLAFGWIYLKWAGRWLERWQGKWRRRHLRVVGFDDRDDDAARRGPWNN